MSEVSYSLRDLIAAASAAEGVALNERTARHYMDEGLVPPARTKNGVGQYGEEHLLRLRMVIRLVAQYVPLKEIERYLGRVPVAGLRALLDRPPIPRLPAEGDTQAYLDRLFRAIPPSLRVGSEAGAVLPSVAGVRPRGVGHARRPERTEWLHIVVAADVELLVRTPASSNPRLVDLLAEAVQKVLVAERGKVS